MPTDQSSFPLEFAYIRTCFQALSERRYHDALEAAKDGIAENRKCADAIKSAELLKHFDNLIDYLEFRLRADFGEKWGRKRESREPSDIKCSFCGKEPSEARTIIAGAAVYICDGCVGICSDILTKESGDRSPGS